MRLTSRVLLVAALALTSVPIAAQSRPSSPAAPYWSGVRERFSGDRAKETVAFLDQYVRWPGNRGFDASIAHIVERLERAGYVAESRATPGTRLTYRVEKYPMAAPAWEPTGAQLGIVGEAGPVLRFETNRNMLANNSYSTAGGAVEAELVDAGDGNPARLDSLAVRGKIVLARTSIGRVFTEAVVNRGALGVLTYSLPAYLKPEVNRNSIQFGGIPRDTAAKGWGIVLSYQAHERLKAALARGVTRVRVATEVQWTQNAVEQAVIAEVRGSKLPGERFVFSAHVQEPGANDNASGVGAQVEMARVAAEMLTARTIIRPARSRCSGASRFAAPIATSRRTRCARVGFAGGCRSTWWAKTSRRPAARS